MEHQLSTFIGAFGFEYMIKKMPYVNFNFNNSFKIFY